MGQARGDLAPTPTSARCGSSSCFKGVGKMQTQGLLCAWQDGLNDLSVPSQPQLGGEQTEPLEGDQYKPVVVSSNLRGGGG